MISTVFTLSYKKKKALNAFVRCVYPVLTTRVSHWSAALLVPGSLGVSCLSQAWFLLLKTLSSLLCNLHLAWRLRLASLPAYSCTRVSIGNLQLWDIICHFGFWAVSIKKKLLSVLRRNFTDMLEKQWNMWFAIGRGMQFDLLSWWGCDFSVLMFWHNMVSCITEVLYH